MPISVFGWLLVFLWTFALIRCGMRVQVFHEHETPAVRANQTSAHLVPRYTSGFT